MCAVDDGVAVSLQMGSKRPNRSHTGSVPQVCCVSRDDKVLCCHWGYGRRRSHATACLVIAHAPVLSCAGAVLAPVGTMPLQAARRPPAAWLMRAVCHAHRSARWGAGAGHRLHQGRALAVNADQTQCEWSARWTPWPSLCRPARCMNPKSRDRAQGVAYVTLGVGCLLGRSQETASGLAGGRGSRARACAAPGGALRLRPTLAPCWQSLRWPCHSAFVYDNTRPHAWLVITNFKRVHKRSVSKAFGICVTRASQP